jgi:hypothetical protein
MVGCEDDEIGTSGKVLDQKLRFQPERKKGKHRNGVSAKRRVDEFMMTSQNEPHPGRY